MVRYVSYLTTREAEIMFILRAIGNFFVKIGRWIKNTAWVQPLLIVGGIFAIIFSIPYISAWVSSWSKGVSEGQAFYSAFKVNLDGCQYDEKNSDANKLFNYMSNEIKSPDEVNRWGEKFFVVFVQEDCQSCEDIYKGFSILKNEWNTGSFKTPEGETYNDFKLYTIYIDTEATVNNETKNLFKDYFYDGYDMKFDQIIANAEFSDYGKNMGKSYREKLADALTVSKFASPTIFLYDAKGGRTDSLGVTDVILDLTGKDKQSGVYPLAYTLFDCWYHQDIFGPNYQPKN